MFSTYSSTRSFYKSLSQTPQFVLNKRVSNPHILPMDVSIIQRAMIAVLFKDNYIQIVLQINTYTIMSASDNEYEQYLNEFERYSYL